MVTHRLTDWNEVQVAQSTRLIKARIQASDSRYLSLARAMRAFIWRRNNNYVRSSMRLVSADAGRESISQCDGTQFYTLYRVKQSGIVTRITSRLGS